MSINEKIISEDDWRKFIKDFQFQNDEQFTVRELHIAKISWNVAIELIKEKLENENRN